MVTSYSFFIKDRTRREIAYFSNLIHTNNLTLEEAVQKSVDRLEDEIQALIKVKNSISEID